MIWTDPGAKKTSAWGGLLVFLWLGALISVLLVANAATISSVVMFTVLLVLVYLPSLQRALNKNSPLRHSMVLTNHRFMWKRFFQRPMEVNLAAVRDVRREIILTRRQGRYVSIRKVYGDYSSYPDEEVSDGDRVVLETSHGRVITPDLENPQGLMDLVAQAQKFRTVDLSRMTDLRTGVAPALQRVDILLLEKHFVGKDVYGPIFIGEQWIVRFTEELSQAVKTRLMHQLGDPAGTALESEKFVLDLAKSPQAGYVMTLKRERADCNLSGNELTLKQGDIEICCQLQTQDVKRTQEYLDTHRFNRGPRG